MLDQLTRSELLQMMELATQCLAVTSPDQLGTIISSINSLASYSKAALCAFTCNDNELALTHYVNHSYGDEWADLYASQNFQHSDPVLIHASSTNGAFRWDEIPASANREGSAVFLEAAKDFGIADGVGVSCAGRSPSCRSVLSLTGVPVLEMERTQQILTVLGPHLHEAYRRLLHLPPDRGSAQRRNGGRKNTAAVPARQHSDMEISARQNPGVELSEREREALNWAQQGKTYWEIGCILGISQRTVKFHFARIKSKLDVVSTPHAIAKAMRMGLIT
jgi:LuxR family quorum-sensing system transcriptional regulator ExpR